MDKLISIIIPIYNVERYLKDCIESVRRQIYDNLEIILVNDGSTDRCLEICIKYARIDNRIVVVDKENGGLSDARNAGIEASHGKYIFFLDSDDIIANNTISELFMIADKYKVDIVQCSFKPFKTGQKISMKDKRKKVICFSGRDFLYESYERRINSTVSAAAKLIRRDIMGDIRFPFGKLHEDVFTTYKIIYNSERVAYIDYPFYLYRLSEGSIMRRSFSIERLDWIEGLENKLEFYESKSDSKLYNRTFQEYLAVLLKLNYLVKKNKLKEASDLTVKYRAKFTDALRMSEVHFAAKILFIAGFFSPYLVGWFVDKVT